MSEGPERLFLFVQCELPWALGPPDGRYLLRSLADGEPERVVILATLAAGQAASARGGGPLRRRAAARRREAKPEPEPVPVATTRATIVDPVSVSAERQARAWLSDLDSEHEVRVAFVALNRVLHAQRIAAADPYAREVSPPQALVIRAGWGEGEQVAEGLWLHAVELPWTGPTERTRRRGAALRTDERLAELLAGRERPLVCEEHALRARLDLDQGRAGHAAIELDLALSAVRRELAGPQPGDLPLRIDELASLHPSVARVSRGALGQPEPESPEEPGASETVGVSERSDAEELRHVLGRLEAALRARTAAGFDRSRRVEP